MNALKEQDDTVRKVVPIQLVAFDVHVVLAGKWLSIHRSVLVSHVSLLMAN